MTMKKITRIVSLFFLTLTISGWEYASAPPSDEQMLNKAERIVLARCFNSEARKTEGGNIYTFVDFELMKLIKGEISSRFNLQMFGGRIGNESQEITGLTLPEFHPGDIVILLLGKDNDRGIPFLYMGEKWIYSIKDEKGSLLAKDPPNIPLYRAGTNQDIFAPEPIGGNTDLFGQKDLNEVFSQASSQFPQATIQDFSKSVAVEDLIWSIKQVLQK